MEYVFFSLRCRSISFVKKGNRNCALHLILSLATQCCAVQVKKKSIMELWLAWTRAVLWGVWSNTLGKLKLYQAHMCPAVLSSAVFAIFL
ncbi:hypothetical protein XENTR_v10018415 [Xenopus tropicalis]|nr:hypothetical protein XENTR_v10018415 [Xenopus tropicalis]